MPMLCIKEFKKTFSLARKSTEYNCTSPLSFITSIGALNLRELRTLKIGERSTSYKGERNCIPPVNVSYERFKPEQSI